MKRPGIGHLQIRFSRDKLPSLQDLLAALMHGLRGRIDVFRIMSRNQKSVTLFISPAPEHAEDPFTEAEQPLHLEPPAQCASTRTFGSYRHVPLARGPRVDTLGVPGRGSIGIPVPSPATYYVATSPDGWSPAPIGRSWNPTRIRNGGKLHARCTRRCRPRTAFCGADPPRSQPLSSVGIRRDHDGRSVPIGGARGTEGAKEGTADSLGRTAGTRERVPLDRHGSPLEDPDARDVTEAPCPRTQRAGLSSSSRPWALRFPPEGPPCPRSCGASCTQPPRGSPASTQAAGRSSKTARARRALPRRQGARDKYPNVRRCDMLFAILVVAAYLVRFAAQWVRIL